MAATVPPMIERQHKKGNKSRSSLLVPEVNGMDVSVIIFLVVKIGWRFRGGGGVVIVTSKGYSDTRAQQETVCPVLGPQIASIGVDANGMTEAEL